MTIQITARHFEMINDFVPYFNSFYGKDGLYPHNRDYTSADVIKAMAVLFTHKPHHEFEGDSVDRELIRDIMLESATMIKHFEKKVV